LNNKICIENKISHFDSGLL